MALLVIGYRLKAMGYKARGERQEARGERQEARGERRGVPSVTQTLILLIMLNFGASEVPGSMAPCLP